MIMNKGIRTQVQGSNISEPNITEEDRIETSKGGIFFSDRTLPRQTKTDAKE